MLRLALAMIVLCLTLEVGSAQDCLNGRCPTRRVAAAPVAPLHVSHSAPVPVAPLHEMPVSTSHYVQQDAIPQGYSVQVEGGDSCYPQTVVQQKRQRVIQATPIRTFIRRIFKKCS